MFAKKLSCLLFLSVLILLSSCQNETEEITQPPESSPETLAESPQETPEETPSSEPTVEEEPIQEVFTEAQQISISCGTDQEFQTLQIMAECPVDEDRDDRFDSEVSSIEFSNPSEKQEVYLTFPTNLSNLSSLVGLDSKQPPYETLTIKPQSKTVIEVNNKTFNPQTNSFSLQVGLGKVEIPVNDLAQDVFTDTLNCQTNVGEKVIKFGLEYQLSCNKNPESSEPSYLFLKNIAAAPRAIKLTSSEDNVDKTLSVLSLYSMGEGKLPILNDQEYILEIFIPQTPTP